jgi:hypothetical protein
MNIFDGDSKKMVSAIKGFICITSALNSWQSHFYGRMVVLLCLMMVSVQLWAQRQVIHQNLYWVRYTNTIALNNPKLSVQFEAEGRRFFETSERHHFIMHSRLHYRVTPQFNVAGGITYSRQSTQFPFRDFNLVVPEIRLVQEANYNIPISRRVSIQQRLRIDNRFIRSNDGRILNEGYYFNFRFRFRLQGSFLLNKDLSKNATILKVSNEVMVNAGSRIVYNIFDQNRIYLGVEKRFSKSISGEIGYLHWYQQTSAGDIFFNRNIIRTTLFHNIKLSKAKVEAIPITE